MKESKRKINEIARLEALSNQELYDEMESAFTADDYGGGFTTFGAERMKAYQAELHKRLLSIGFFGG